MSDQKNQVKLSVTFPESLLEQIEKWKEFFIEKNQTPISRNSAIMALIQRGLKVSKK